MSGTARLCEGNSNIKINRMEILARSTYSMFLGPRPTLMMAWRQENGPTSPYRCYSSQSEVKVFP